MAMKTLIDRLCRTVRNFRAANGANVTITFALATIPMVGFVGAAVDYSHANSVKAAMQAAANSTALMLSKDAATLTTASLQTKANSYFTALFTRPEATGLVVTATYNTTNGSQVVVNASSNVKANFMGLMGISTMKVGADSQVKWGNTKMRVALVLDNTGSMADDGKMPALITATNTLLTQLKSAAVTNGDVYVSIIPFVKDVNIGSSNYNASWIDWTDWEKVSCAKGRRSLLRLIASGACRRSRPVVGSFRKERLFPASDATRVKVEWNPSLAAIAAAAWFYLSGCYLNEESPARCWSWPRRTLLRASPGSSPALSSRP